MEPRDGAAGDGDEAERKDLAREHRPVAVDEAGERRHVDLRLHEENAHGHGEDRPHLDEGGEIVPRREQEPNRQGRRGEAVEDDRSRECRPGQGEDGSPGGRVSDPLPGDHREAREDEADGGCLHHAAGPEEAKVDPHQHGDGHGHGQGVGAPGRRLERVHHHERHHREQDDHDDEHGDEGDEPPARAHLFLGHLAESLAPASHRAEEDHEVLDAARETGADDEPEGSGQIAELGREGRPYEGSRPRDRREVVAEEHPLVGGHVVAPVLLDLGGGGPRIVQGHDLRGDERGIEPVGQAVGADRRDHEPGPGDRLAARERDTGEGAGPEERDQDPAEHAERRFHSVSRPLRTAWRGRCPDPRAR